MIDQIKDWRAYLQEKESEEDLEKIRKSKVPVILSQ